MTNTAFDLTWIIFPSLLCVFTASASVSPTEKLPKFATRATSDEEEIGLSLSPANEEVSYRFDL